MAAVLLLSLAAQLAFSAPTAQDSAPELQVREEHVFSPHTADLTRRYVEGTSKRLGRRATAGTVSIEDNKQLKYFVPVTIGTQTLELELDTGSSDTWVIQQGFQCFEDFDPTSQQFENAEPLTYCNMGPGLKPEDTFVVDEDLYQLTCYGSSAEPHQRCLSGAFARSPVSLAGFKVPNQLVGAPSLSSFPAAGRRIQSGLIGMAFPILTSAYNATTSYPVEYNSIMANIESLDNGLPKQFAIALSRDNAKQAAGGSLTVGGVPKLHAPTVNVSSTKFTSAPFQFYTNISDTAYSFYSIKVDGFKVGKTTSGAHQQIIIDSGAPTIDLPEAIANSVNSHWSPKGKLDEYGDFNIKCNAKLTQPFGVTVGGTTYYVNPVDLIGHYGDGTCYSNVNAGSDGEFLIGDPFLKNVVAVYDWGHKRMSFYPRMYYKS